jgi:hypothetical protein
VTAGEARPVICAVVSLPGRDRSTEEGLNSRRRARLVGRKATLGGGAKGRDPQNRSSQVASAAATAAQKPMISSGRRRMHWLRVMPSETARP